MSKAKGFTLVELMVVILIVSILAAVAIPLMRGRIDAAKWSEGKAMMGTIATGIRAYQAEKGPTGTAPTTLVQLGFVAGDFDGTYFSEACFSYSVTDMGGATGSLKFTVTCNSGSSTRPSPPTALTRTLNQAGIFNPE
jgi:type IV pilus assembly protein PilA